jgi:hypothetical protein
MLRSKAVKTNQPYTLLSLAGLCKAGASQAFYDFTEERLSTEISSIEFLPADYYNTSRSEEVRSLKV